MSTFSVRLKHIVSPATSGNPTLGPESGSTVLVALMTVVILAMLAGTVLTSVSSRYNSAYRSAAWNEALITAESGIDMTLAEVFRQIPNVTVSPSQGLGVGYSQNMTQTIPAGLQIPLLSNLLTTGTTKTLVSFTPQPLIHGGEGGTTQTATIAIDMPFLSDLLSSGLPGVVNTVNGLLNGNKLQLLRLTSTGTVSLTGRQIAGPSRLDNELWRPSLITDRFTGQATQPSISRKVQVILRPVYPFESAVVSNDILQAPKAGTVFDSFNSTLNTASTNGLYDSLKRLSHGAVKSNAATVNIGGTVYGDVSTNGANVAQDAHVTGTVNNAAFITLPVVNAPPLWLNPLFVPSAINADTTISSGLPLIPVQYRFTGIKANLHVTGLPGTNVDIYVNGDFTGGIEVDNGITARIYVSGSINTNASRIKNDTQRAVNLQIYGVPNGSGASQSIQINMDAAMYASVYAPMHDVSLNGSGDFSGSIVGNRFQASGAVRVHYDESLAAGIGPLLRYQIASWNEIPK